MKFREKGLCIVDLFDDDRSRVVTKPKGYEINKLECNPHVSHSPIVVSCSGSTITLWDINAGKALCASLPAHQRAVTGNIAIQYID